MFKPAKATAREEYSGAENDFGRRLHYYRTRANKSIPTIAIEVGVDRAYLYRLEQQNADWLNRPLEGGRLKHPSRDLVIRLAIALGLSLDECDELLLRAGYAPLFPFRAVAKSGPAEA